jgi:hypothetical protein
MQVLLMTILSLSNVICFVIGAKVGQTVSKGEKVEMPNLNPLKAYRESQARKEAEMQQDKLSKVLRNIERYDGTSKGQEDVG